MLFHFSDTPVLDASANPEEEEEVFNTFLKEAQSAFRKYQVIYLKGISKPTRYSDLLPASNYTNFSAVSWDGVPPSNTNFSLVHYSLSEDEQEQHASDIKLKVTNAAHMWMH